VARVKTSKLDSNVVFLVRFHDEGLLSGPAYVPSISSEPSSERLKDRFPIRTVQRAHVANKIVVLWATKMSVIVS